MNHRFYFILFCFFPYFESLSSFHIDNIWTATANQNQPSCSPTAGCNCFAKTKNILPNIEIITSPLSLLQAAKDTLYYINHKKGRIQSTFEPVHFKKLISFKQVEETLNFIISIIEEDKKKKKFRILDPTFINKHFCFIQWNAPQKTTIKNNTQPSINENIKLTNYVIYCVQGNPQKTKRFNCALYKLLDKSLAPKFTKQKILSGIFESPTYKNKVKPLVWLTREDFEDVLLQGSTLVQIPNKTYKIFLVDTCNGITYKKNIKNQQQQRYWFYREAKSNLASISAFKKRIQLRKKVIFAGDINNIGIGKIIAINHINPMTKKRELHLGVLADTGGAFVNNIYQLDLFLGMFNNKKALKNQQRNFPNTTQALILYKRL
jgi:hypothetical protein